MMGADRQTNEQTDTGRWTDAGENNPSTEETEG